MNSPKKDISDIDKQCLNYLNDKQTNQTDQKNLLTVFILKNEKNLWKYENQEYITIKQENDYQQVEEQESRISIQGADHYQVQEQESKETNLRKRRSDLLIEIVQTELQKNDLTRGENSNQIIQEIQQLYLGYMEINKDNKLQHQTKLQQNLTLQEFIVKQILDKWDIKENQEERVFKCEVDGCGKIYTSDQAMVKHLPVHEEAKKHKCPITDCPKLFMTKSSLNRHVTLSKKHEKDMVFDFNYKNPEIRRLKIWKDSIPHRLIGENGEQIGIRRNHMPPQLTGDNEAQPQSSTQGSTQSSRSQIPLQQAGDNRKAMNPSANIPLLQNNQRGIFQAQNQPPQVMNMTQNQPQVMTQMPIMVNDSLNVMNYQVTPQIQQTSVNYANSAYQLQPYYYQNNPVFQKDFTLQPGLLVTPPLQPGLLVTPRVYVQQNQHQQPQLLIRRDVHGQQQSYLRTQHEQQEQPLFADHNINNLNRVNQVFRGQNNINPRGQFQQ